jgi:uncharacterized protein (DUF2236 family)
MTFGPGSLLFETMGDRRGMLLAPAEGLMQLMYPALGRGVEQHSAFYDEPLERLFRSVPQIQGTVFDAELAAATARQVRDYHAPIKGEMPDGSRYSALDPDTFFWAHATFIDVIFRASDLFWARPLTHTQRAAYYREGIDWWRMYGLSMRPVPPTYEEFLEYWDHHLENVLEATPSALRLIEFFEQPQTMAQPWIPPALWRAVGPALGLGYREFFVGTVPPRVREICGLRWTRANQVAFDAARAAIARLWPRLPYRVRVMPRARTAYREQGRIGRGAALRRAEITPARLAS